MEKTQRIDVQLNNSDEIQTATKYIIKQNDIRFVAVRPTPSDIQGSTAMGCLESLHTSIVFLLLGGRVLKWEEKQRPSSQQKDSHARVKREQNSEREKNLADHTVLFSIRFNTNT